MDTDATCVICALTIRPRHIETQTRLCSGGVEIMVWTYFDCFNIWQRASRFMDENGLSAWRIAHAKC